MDKMTPKSPSSRFNVPPGFGVLIVTAILLLAWLAALLIAVLMRWLSVPEALFVVENTGLVMLFGGTASLIFYGLVQRTPHKGTKTFGILLMLVVLVVGAILYTLFETAAPAFGFATMALLVNPLALLGFVNGVLIAYLFVTTRRS